VFGALVCRAFSEFIEQRTVATGQYCEPIGHRDEYAYLVIEDLAWDLLVPDLIEFFLDIPEFFLDEVIPDGDTRAGRRLFSKRSTRLSFWAMGYVCLIIGKILFDGLNELQSVVIVPQKVLTDSEIKHTFAF